MDLPTDPADAADDKQVQEEVKSLEHLNEQLQEPTKVLLEQHRLLPLLGQLKVLSRKEHIRKAIGKDGIKSLVRHLNNSKHIIKAAAEGANVILNVCYEKENVHEVLDCGGTATLVGFLLSDDEELQANSAGALQSICFQPEGRLAVRALGAIPQLIALLDAEAISVKARAVGALHNMSSDVYAIPVIRRKGGIKSLVQLLRSENHSVRGSAAGALQNVSREVASRLIIRESPALPLLVDLLSNSEVQVQVSAAGALLNVLGPEMNDTSICQDTMEKKRKAFVSTVIAMLVGSLVHDVCFASCPSKSTYSSHLLRKASEITARWQGFT
ncbi:hypothetical protein R1sor_018352 [Riccia sorocarpa]|uniref:Uncharacterized protein n=1 Tax=Riccia sorocarpa TaxID=122646 RepID=A0ABD3ID09_9MARC